MDDLAEFFGLLALCIVTLSAFMTFVKKVSPDMKDAPKWFYWFVASLLSYCFGYAVHLNNDFGMGDWSIFIYGLAIYSLQYFVSQKVIDKFVNRLIGGKDD